eukprot:scaffold2639_cov361-Pavlova_lutheri.AAC.35
MNACGRTRIPSSLQLCEFHPLDSRFHLGVGRSLSMLEDPMPSRHGSIRDRKITPLPCPPAPVPGPTPPDQSPLATWQTRARLGLRVQATCLPLPDRSRIPFPFDWNSLALSIGQSARV